MANSEAITADWRGQNYGSRLMAGTVLQGRFRVEKPLGKGGMGHVYLVRDERYPGVEVFRSLKEMIFRIDETQVNLANFPREAEMLASLNHPFIPKIYDYFVEPNQRAYLVLEYIEGRDLLDVLDTTPGLLEQNRVIDWMLQLCDIVRYLHTRPMPVIFRDLKPNNVILSPEQRIYLIDFGIARAFDIADEGLVTSVGTKGYAAPEQYAGKAETRSDIYALGAMMHHLLTKEDPRYIHAMRTPRSINPAITPEMEALILKCLEPSVLDRYQTIEELRVALLGALGQPGYAQAAYAQSSPAGASGRLAAAPAGPFAGAATTPVRWRFATEDEVRATPALHQGTLFIGSYDRNLYALDQRTGRLRWKFDTEGGVCCRATVWRNLVIFGSEDFNVYAVDLASGAEVWRYRTWNHVRSSPLVVEDKVYVGSDDGFLHAMDARSGRLLWRYQTYGKVQSAPAYANGLIYVGSNDTFLYAVDALTGERKWRFATQGPVISSPALRDGVIYFGSMDGGVYAVDAKTGWQAWREPTDHYVTSSPCVTADAVYIGSMDKHLYRLDRLTGKRVWRFETQQKVNSTPALANGVVYVGSNDSGVYALDARAGRLRWRFQLGGMAPGSPVVADDLVYIGSADCNVYALATQA